MYLCTISIICFGCVYTAPIVGHVGDGNFHALIVFNPEDPADYQTAENLANQIAELIHHSDTILQIKIHVPFKFIQASFGTWWDLYRRTR